jgi:hypothetical protein
MAFALKDGNPAPDVLPQDQIPMLRGTMIGMSVYGWIFFALTLFLMKPVRTHKWWMGAFINICLGVPRTSLYPHGNPVELKGSP